MNIFNTILIQPLANGLMLFYRILGGNMGLAIIGFSLALRTLLNPLTKPYMASMKKMKEVEPLLNKLKAKYGKEPKKLAEAQGNLYKEKGINPAAGCLPYILQIVVLIALFNVFSRALAGGPDSLNKFNALLYTPLKLTAGQTLNTHFLYFDVTKHDNLRDQFGVNPLPFPIPGPILIIAAILQLVASMMMAPVVREEEKLAKKTKGQVDDMQVSMQKSMAYTFPLMTLFIGVNFPLGLSLYWSLFSLWQVVQQYQTSGWGGVAPFISKLRMSKAWPFSK